MLTGQLPNDTLPLVVRMIPVHLATTAAARQALHPTSDRYERGSTTEEVVATVDDVYPVIAILSLITLKNALCRSGI